MGEDNSAITKEISTRRKFLKVITVGLSGLIGLALGIPFIGTLIARSTRMGKPPLASVTPVSNLPVGQPDRVNFEWPEKDAYIHSNTTHSVWAIKHDPTDVTVFSPICPHAGCYYNWVPSANQFHCPCHGSVFSITGKVLGGPAPRPLDTLPHEINNGELEVRWERFKSGIPEKVRIS